MRCQEDNIFSVCSSGNEEALRRILRENPDAVHLRDAEGNTPLHFAKDDKIAQILLQAGADPEARNHVGMTPIGTACEQRRKSVVEVLLEKGVSLRKKYYDSASWEICGLIEKHLKKVENRKLHEAQTLEEVKQLLAEGEKINGRAKWGKTPLMFHVIEQRQEIVEYLIKQGAELDAQDEEGFTALHYAALKKAKPIVEILLKAGANPNVQNEKGETPLHLAVFALEKTYLQEVIESRLIVEILLKAGANPNLQNKKGETPLHLVVPALKRAYLQEEARLIVEILLKAGANPNLQNEKGETPLHLAVSTKDRELVDLLLAFGADLQIRSKKGHLPMHGMFFSYLKQKTEQLPNPYPPVPDAKPYHFVAHPTRSLLVSAMEGGLLVKWSYDPDHPQKEEFLWELKHGLLDKVDFASFLKQEMKIQTDQYRHKLSLYWDGDSFLVQAPQLGCIERRSFETMEVLERIPGSYHSRISSNGKWLLDDEKFRSYSGGWLLCKLIDLETKETDWFIDGSIFSPDGKYIYFIEDDQGGRSISINSNPFLGDQASLYFYFDIDSGKFHPWSDDLVFSPDEKWFAIWGRPSDYPRRPNEWIGDVVVLSTRRKRIKWRAPVRVEITEENPCNRRARSGRSVRSLLFAGNELVAECSGGWLVFFDAETGELTRKIFFEEKEIQCVMIDHTGKNLFVRTSVRDYTIPL